MIYHIAEQDEWQRSEDFYAPSGFDREGFVHCSDEQQVLRIANQLFRGQADLVLLKIDPTMLKSKIVYENTEGGTELFPHVYGPINKSAVRDVLKFNPRENGSFALPRAVR